MLRGRGGPFDGGLWSCAGSLWADGARAGMHWKGGEVTPLPLRDAYPMPVSLTPSAGLNGIYNRQ